MTDDLLSRLAGEVLELRENSNEPITVFINSVGGSVRCLDFLYGLLTTRNPSGKKPRIITVAVGYAHSAAASLLSLGNYAISYPKSSIHFHGVRYGSVQDVTAEAASTMAAQLDAHNRQTAHRLATAGIERLAFHYARLRHDFDDLRHSVGDHELSAIECFARRLKRELSDHGNVIVDKALGRWRSLQQVSKEVLPKTASCGKSGIEYDAEVLRHIIEFEVTKNNGPGAALDAQVVYQIAADYLLLRDYHLPAQQNRVAAIVERYPSVFFDNPDLIEQFRSKKVEGRIDQSVIDQVDQIVRPFCYFSSTIWQALQEEENPLSPRDAYWLGAVDEIYGSNLPCLREIAESDSVEQTQLPLSGEKPPGQHVG